MGVAAMREEVAKPFARQLIVLGAMQKRQSLCDVPSAATRPSNEMSRQNEADQMMIIFLIGSAVSTDTTGPATSQPIKLSDNPPSVISSRSDCPALSTFSFGGRLLRQLELSVDSSALILTDVIVCRVSVGDARVRRHVSPSFFLLW